MSKYKIYFFDLDGTITESKQNIRPEMSEAVAELIKNNPVAIIGGGSIEQFRNQFLDFLPDNLNKENLYLMPTSGSALFVYDNLNKTWGKVFENAISEEEAETIVRELKLALLENGIEISAGQYGDLFENRGTQITFSALGQNAPIDEKKNWDLDHSKREKVVDLFLSRVSDFEVKIGGMTSIDITKKGIDKEYGVNILCKHLRVKPEECVFVGDEFFEKGNDVSVKKTGIEIVVVNNPNETLNFIRWHALTKVGPIFTRPKINPILSSIESHKWENKNVFNPAAFELNGKVHILYRAMSEENVSVIGYATSTNGTEIDYRHDDPIYIPRADFEIQKRGPNINSGCEDPRVSVIDDKIYMAYTAYNGVDKPAIAMTSILVKDFQEHSFDKWSLPVQISPKDIDDKDGALFPKKIGKRYLFIHRVSSVVCVDYVNDLNFTKYEVDTCIEILKPRPGMWDNLKVGVASTPHLTEKGWLLFYHGVSGDLVYRVGAALLDRDDPTKVIGRTIFPIFEPETQYEINGEVPNVVFPCGSVIRNDEVFIYYGAADKYVGVAVAKLDNIFDSLIII